MGEITTVGLDLAKRVVSLCGECACRARRRDAALGGAAAWRGNSSICASSTRIWPTAPSHSRRATIQVPATSR